MKREMPAFKRKRGLEKQGGAKPRSGLHSSYHFASWKFRSKEGAPSISPLCKDLGFHIPISTVELSRVSLGSKGNTEPLVKRGGSVL